MCFAREMQASADGARTETVRFADPRWPSVQVIRGATAIPLAAPAPVFHATSANTEVVTFGDGTGTSVKIVRGSDVAPPAGPPAGRVQTVRFGGLGGPSVDIVR